MLTITDNEMWQCYYDRTRTASFFQSPQWAAIWSRYTSNKYRPVPLLARTPSGKEVLIPMTCQRILAGLIPLWHAAPAGTYGGWLSHPNVTLTADEQHFILRELISYCGSLTVRWFPFSDTMVEHSDSFIASNRQDDTMELIQDQTYALDCSPGYEAIRSDWARDGGSMKRKLNKAEQADVHIRQAATKDDWERYYQLYLENSTRWDPPPSYIYRPDFFDILACGDNPCELWLAEWSGKVVAGAVIMPGRNHTTYWHGASHAESHSVRPVNLLIARLIEQTCIRGHRWFDFNPSMGIPGVEAFKKSFGAILFSAPVLYHHALQLKMAQRVGSLLPGKKWARRFVHKRIFHR